MPENRRRALRERFQNRPGPRDRPFFDRPTPDGAPPPPPPGARPPREGP
jgi:hypothetical protein